jgi:hypothetical protein
MSIDILFDSLLIVMFRNLILLSIYFSIVNFSFGDMLLTQPRRVSILVFSSPYTMIISLPYLKYPLIS